MDRGENSTDDNQNATSASELYARLKARGFIVKRGYSNNGLIKPTHDTDSSNVNNHIRREPEST